MTTYTFKSNPYTCEIPESMLDDILSMALDGGITYWCGYAEPVDENGNKTKHLGDFLHEQILKDGNIKLYDAESNDTWILTPENFMKGVSQYISQNSSILIYHGNTAIVDEMKLDAASADEIIQYALFEEVVFG